MCFSDLADPVLAGPLFQSITLVVSIRGSQKIITTVLAIALHHLLQHDGNSNHII